MMSNDSNKNETLEPIKEAEWGKIGNDQMGYGSEEERYAKRGLEDWEMVEKMETSEHRIPYWFFALFGVLLLVAVGLTFPFWGVRPGYERSWFDWGIPIGVAWCVTMAGVIYYMVDYRHRDSDARADQARKEAELDSLLRNDKKDL
ncbi:MAG: hypothetical protein L3J89_01370 [Gammaproteobacteria bacterium]|nr:hypothetical protein [Gammaproteobacteria bacterium]